MLNQVQRKERRLNRQKRIKETIAHLAPKLADEVQDVLLSLVDKDERQALVAVKSYIEVMLKDDDVDLGELTHLATLLMDVVALRIDKDNAGPDVDE